jgi:tetratricopeptide (TPR) repeat protein
VFSARHELARALQRAQDALAVVRALDDREGTATTLGLIGDIHRRTGNRAQARVVLQECIDLAAELDFHYVESDARLMLALVALDDGDVPAAVAGARRAVELARRAGSPLGECQGLEGLGWALLEQARIDSASDVAAQARNAFEAARALAAELGLRSAQSEMTAGLAAAALAAGDQPAAASELASLPVEVLGDSTLAPAKAMLAVLAVQASSDNKAGRHVVASHAAGWLQQVVERIGDDVLASGFLDGVPDNVRLAAAVGFVGGRPPE